MTERSELHVEDIEEAVRACRPVRPRGPRRVRTGDLSFRSAALDDPAPAGLQIPELADARARHSDSRSSLSITSPR